MHHLTHKIDTTNIIYIINYHFLETVEVHKENLFKKTLIFFRN